MKKVVAFISLLFVFGASLARAEDGPQFPHREKFKAIPVYELEMLHKQLGQVVVVDVRSRYEYDTLHIKGAQHIPLHKDKLPAAIRDLRTKTSQPIVFYCNGTTCKKSYEAAEYSMKAGIRDVYAYDAGIDAWSHKHPELCVLMGKSEVQSKDLISKSEFKKRLITTPDFEARVEQGAVVLDIRDLRQRDVALFPMRELRAPLDDSQKIADAMDAVKRQKKPLLVYDKVGKQTRWFQYYLEQHGIKDYYFLDGGSEAYYEAKFGKLKFAVPEQG